MNKKLVLAFLLLTFILTACVTVSQENAPRNTAAALELTGATVDQVTGRFELVLANILANTLVELAPLIAAKVTDRLVLAGVLAPQAEEVTRAYEAVGLRRLATRAIDEWVRIDLHRGS